MGVWLATLKHLAVFVLSKPSGLSTSMLNANVASTKTGPSLKRRLLRADKHVFDGKKAAFRNSRTRRTGSRDTPMVVRDTVVRKVFLDRKPGKIIRRDGPTLKYRPKEVRFVYRNLRKNIVLRTQDWDTRIKYLNGKGKDLNILKQKILIMENKVNKRHKRKKRKK